MSVTAETSGASAIRPFQVDIPEEAVEDLRRRARWSGDTPLWLYVLLGAEHRGGRARLGPVGGRIVAEVLIGIISPDPTSYRSREPDWTPPLPAPGNASSSRTL